MTMKHLAATAVSLMLTTTLATAGGHDNLGTASAGSAVRAASAAQSVDWSGVYLGGSISSITGGSLSSDDTGESFDMDRHNPIGLFIGYQGQTGQFVIGGEYAISAATNATFGGGSNEFAAAYGDLKARLGYASGPVLFYSVIGISATAFDDSDGNDFSSNGFGYGLGVDYAVSPNMFFGGEYYSRTTEGDITVSGTTADTEIDADTFTFRAAYKF